MTVHRLFGVASLLALIVGFSLAVTSPPDAVQGEFVRNMYVHVPSAWLAFFAFGVTLAASAGWLWRRGQTIDHIAEASAEIGVFFTGLTLLTGMIWGRPVWGTWWSWSDARMTSTAVMLFLYLGYMALRRSVQDPGVRADRAAILGVAAFPIIPIVFFSVNVFRTLHQSQTIRPDEVAMAPEMLRAFLTNLAAFTVLYFYFLIRRVAIARLEFTEETLIDV